MRQTFVLTLDDELAEFIHHYPGIEDPAALINKLFHDDMKNNGYSVQNQLSYDQDEQELEIMLDQSTPAAD